MVRFAASFVALLALFASFTAVNLSSSLGHNLADDTTWTQAVQTLIPLAAMGGLLAAVAYVYYNLHRAAVASMEVATGIACAAVGLLEFFFAFHVQAQVDDGAKARELRMAAAHVLPAAATTAFFLGVAVLFLHLRAGGGAVAGEGPVQIFIKVAAGATSVLLGLMAMAL